MPEGLKGRFQDPTSTRTHFHLYPRKHGSVSSRRTGQDRASPFLRNPSTRKENTAEDHEDSYLAASHPRPVHSALYEQTKRRAEDANKES